MTDIIPDTAAAMEFLDWWAPDGPWTLTAITPDKKSVETRAFELGRRDAMEKWIKSKNGLANLYFMVNPVIRLENKKAKRDNVKSLAWLHVDIDPRKLNPDDKTDVQEHIREEKDRNVKRLMEGHGGLPVPSCIIDSGGGVQAFWKLWEAQPIDGDEARYEDLKRYNKAIEVIHDADDCHNVDRIMRLPGTVNLPDAKKKKAGRQQALASVLHLSDKKFHIEDFKPAPKADTDAGGTGFTNNVADVDIGGNVQRLNDVDDLPDNVGDRVKMIIVQGHDPDDPNKWPSGSEVVWWVVNELVRCDVPDEMIFAVLTDPGFDISAHVLRQSNPRDYAKRQIGRAKEASIHPMLEQFNREFAVVENFGGKCRVVSEYIDPMTNRVALSFISFEDFRNAHMNRHIEIPNPKGGVWKVGAGKWWLEHPNRRQYKRVIFDPAAPDDPTVMNRWRGFGVAARPGAAHEDFLNHLHQNLCGGDEASYQYLVQWMANAVQKPGEVGHVAVVMRGAQGTGKSFFAKVFGKLFGRHFMHVTNPTHLVGQFNAHLEDCVLLFADEAFFAGDRKHESVLKTLITEDVRIVEHKGVNAEQRKSCLHLIMASNSDWVVPVALDDRRFFVLDVNDTKKEDRSYFGDIIRQMEAGGYESLLHFLLGLDLSKFDVTKFPKTAAFHEQRQMGAPSWIQWWVNKLRDGVLLPTDTNWKDFVSRQDLLDDYVQFMQKWHRYDRPVSQLQLIQHLGDLITGQPGGKLKRSRRKIYKQTMDPSGHVITRETSADGYAVPDLNTCRSNFGRLYGQLAKFDDLQEVLGFDAEPDPEDII